VADTVWGSAGATGRLCASAREDLIFLPGMFCIYSRLDPCSFMSSEIIRSASNRGLESGVSRPEAVHRLSDFQQDMPSTVDSPQIGHLPDPGNSVAMMTCPISGSHATGEAARPSPQKPVTL
jgi:hypothetical protein